MSKGADSPSEDSQPGWQEVRAWLERLLELPEAEREATLLAECSNESLRTRVLKLLASEAKSESFLDPNTLGDASFLLGRTLGRYRLVRELGRGGQGVVYLAEDPKLGRSVALKVLTALAPHPEQVARFKREASIASRIDHPGICTIHDAGEANGTLYIAMRYVDGTSLSEVIGKDRSTHPENSTQPEPENLKPGPSTSDTKRSDANHRNQELRGNHEANARLIEKVGRALHKAHALGITHRDIKPSNIVVTPQSEPVLMDFGLARDESTATLTKSGDIFGTPAYMAPEQIDAKHGRVDARTDVYALGVTLYELLTGERPFQSATTQGLYREILDATPKAPIAIDASIPKDLCTIVQTALAKAPDERYSSAQDFAEDLRRYLDRKPIRAMPTSRWVHLKRWTQRNSVLAASLAFAFLALSGGLIASISFGIDRDRALTEKSAALARFYKLSDVSEIEQLNREAESLWPRRMPIVPALQAWIQRADRVLARGPGHVAELSALETELGPYTQSLQEMDKKQRRRLFPSMFEELESRMESVSAIRKSQARMAKAEHKALLGDQIRQLERDIEGILDDPRMSERLSLEFDDPSELWRYKILKNLVAELEQLGELRSAIEDRKHFATTIRSKSIEASDTADRWKRCGQAIGQDPVFKGVGDLQPQVALFPLGRDKNSGLWEFWHMGSGSRPQWHGDFESGHAELHKDHTGLVLVLLPGGTFSMGAQRQSRKASNYDRMARPNERPVTEVALAPFFISKFEVTQAQWTRLSKRGTNPSFYAAGSTPAGRVLVTQRNPVEGVSWTEARQFVRKLGLSLPTEAQWEYAARGGTETPWWSGQRPSSLSGIANLADSRSRGLLEKSDSTHKDGHLVHAPVGSFRANPFGLHDVMGNVWEWTNNRFSVYTAKPRQGDGLREPFGAKVVYRGGCHKSPASQCRVSARFTQPTDARGTTPIGIRPVLALSNSGNELRK